MHKKCSYCFYYKISDVTPLKKTQMLQHKQMGMYLSWDIQNKTSSGKYDRNSKYLHIGCARTSQINISRKLRANQLVKVPIMIYNSIAISNVPLMLKHQKFCGALHNKFLKQCSCEHIKHNAEGDGHW